MKNFYKKISLVFTAIMLIVGFAFSQCNPNNAPVTSIGSQTAAIGSSIVVPVKAESCFSCVSAMTLRLYYNPSQLTFVSIANQNPQLEVYLTVVNNLVNATSAFIAVTWSDINGANLVNGSVLFNINYIFNSGPATISFDNVGYSGSYCEFGNCFGDVLVDQPSASYYTDGIINAPACSLAVNAGMDQTIASGQSATFMATTSGGTAPFTYLWSTGTTAPYIVVNPQVSSSYSVTITDANGCTASDQVYVIVNAACNFVVDAGMDQSICFGQQVQLSGSVSGGTAPYNFMWNDGLGGIINPIVEPQVTTTYTLTVVDANACTATDQVTIIVNPLPIVTVYPQNEIICSGSSTNFQIVSNTPSTTFNITASYSGVTPVNQDWTYPVNEQLFGNGTATYTILTVSNMGCAGSPVNYIITVNPLPVLVVSPPSQNLNSGMATDIVLYSDVPASTFSWTVVQNGVTGATAGSGNFINQTLFNTGITSGTAVYTVSAYANGCTSNTFSTVVVTVSPNATFSLSGVVNYNNAANTPLPGITLNLMNGTSQMGTIVTDAAGTFSFSNLLNGTYSITATTTNPWGGCTATDALKLKRHVAGLELFVEPIRLTAADVNNSGNVNATDALKLQRRLAGIETSFARADWNFEFQGTGGNSVIVNDASITQNLYGLCTGDVNGTNPVIVSRHSSVSLNSNTILNTKQGEIVEVPVRISNIADIGALQLFLKYPENLVEISNVSINSRENLIYNSENGVLRIVWSSLESMKLRENDVILNIQLKVIGNTGKVSFRLLSDCEAYRVGNCEFADATGNRINDLDVNIPSIDISNSTSILKNDLLNSINIYPNPSQSNVFVDLGKYSAKEVTVLVCNTIGKVINPQLETESGNRMKLNFSEWATGLYVIKINTPDGEMVKTISINK